MPARIFIGTSSWADKTLAASGKFYPPGLKDTLVTQPKCPLSGRPMGRPVATSHRITDASRLPETSSCPSGLKPRLNTQFE